MVQTVLVSAVTMAASVALALGGLHLVRLRFPHPVRQANNEVAGFFIAVLGVIYAVLLAFVVVTVWAQFDTAHQAVDREANELGAMYRLALALPDPVGSRLQETVRQYAHAVIDEDWPAMGRREATPLHTRRLDDDLWSIAAGYEATTERERLVQAEVLRSVHELTDNRRIRELASRTGLPGVMWGLLIGGAIVTVVFTYFFSTPNPRAQYAMTALYTVSIAFVLVLIELLDFPFSGELRVTPEAFELTLQTLGRLSGQ